MTRAKITERIRLTISDQFGVDSDEVTPSTRLAEDLGSDSLDCVELTMSLEDDFEIHIDDDEADAAKTVEQLVDLIAGKVEVVVE